MSGHTPEPWHAELHEHDDTWTVVAQKPEPETGNFLVAAIGFFEPGEEKANAHLIAAAPDLLAALQAIDDAIGTAFYVNLEDADIARGLVAGARAAIAKATGPHDDE